MSATDRQPVLLRASAAGLLTAALALAAHATGGGHLGLGPATVGLLLVGLTVGATAAALPSTRNVGAMALVLIAGQVVGHAVLLAGHPHTVAGPHGPMLAAHLGAVLLGALLITAGERLCRMLVRVARRAAAPVIAREFGAPRVLTSGDHPLFAELLLAASMSHRGPPVAG